MRVSSEERNYFGNYLIKLDNSLKISHPLRADKSNVRLCFLESKKQLEWQSVEPPLLQIKIKAYYFQDNY